MIFITCFYQISSHNQYSILNNLYTLLERRYWIGKGKGPPEDPPLLLPLIIQREDRRVAAHVKYPYTSSKNLDKLPLFPMRHCLRSEYNSIEVLMSKFPTYNFIWES